MDRMSAVAKGSSWASSGFWLDHVCTQAAIGTDWVCSCTPDLASRLAIACAARSMPA